MDYASLPDHVAGDYRAGRVGYFRFGGHAETRISGVAPSAKVWSWGFIPGQLGEVEEQLAKPLERYLFTFKEVKKKKTYSMSRDGMVYVMVELNDDVNNKDEVWSKIKLGLQTSSRNCPRAYSPSSRMMISAILPPY